MVGRLCRQYILFAIFMANNFFFQKVEVASLFLKCAREHLTHFLTPLVSLRLTIKNIRNKLVYCLPVINTITNITIITNFFLTFYFQVLVTLLNKYGF